MNCAKDDRYIASTIVDHITPHRGDETLFWARWNWQALCKRCHDRKTAQGE
ncbi:HNH endonuclease [Pirellula sp. SH-Sr6A]|uniref:HNH endonuclease n=1 Tax=Pirellula sp. SH-Sr6A TaxID=1632865 RepID=UPI00396565B1